jgi:uncharacterized HAD superfamily protein
MVVVTCDVDGVLADFVLAFTELGHRMFGTPITKTVDHISWNTFPGMANYHVAEVWDAIDESSVFWLGLEPLVEPDIFSRLDRIERRGGSVYFVTARSGKHAKQQTEQWLRTFGITNPTVIVTTSKAETARVVCATHAIDDKAGNAVAIQYMSTAKSYLLDRPYNRFDNSVVGTKIQRITTVDEFLSDVEAYQL